VLRAGWIQGESSVVFGVQKKLEPLLLSHLTHSKSSKKNQNRESYGPPKSRGSKTQKINPSNVIKLVLEHLNNSLYVILLLLELLLLFKDDF
jgi:hypothetical protein